MDKYELITLAASLGLPCIQRRDTITIICEENMYEFKISKTLDISLSVTKEDTK